MSILGTVAKKIIGDNILLRSLVLKDYIQGNYIKATAMTLWMFPLRNVVKLDSPIRKFDIFTSGDYYSELQKLLHISKPEGFDFVRIGREHDGGYIMLDDFHAGDVAYSFGIRDDVSWDKDMTSRGYDVFMYDHTIDGLPEENPRFHWSKLGIADGKTQDVRLKTLDELIRTNHHENTRNMILKMDVEGAEWGFLKQVSSEILSQFSQIALELHWIISGREQETILNSLKQLNKTHQLVHIHPCNFGNYITVGGKKFPDILQALYVKRGSYSCDMNYDVNLPLPIDNTDLDSAPEIELGQWNEYAEIGERFTANVLAV